MLEILCLRQGMIHKSLMPLTPFKLPLIAAHVWQKFYALLEQVYERNVKNQIGKISLINHIFNIAIFSSRGDSVTQTYTQLVQQS